jgi:hypothetical protein
MFTVYDTCIPKSRRRRRRRRRENFDDPKARAEACIFVGC